LTRRATQVDIENYLRLRGTFSQAEAAKQCGFSKDWGRGIEREIRAGTRRANGVRITPGRLGGKAFHEARQIAAVGGPMRYEDLDQVAKDCLEDFGRWRARYLGRFSTPWQEDSAHRIIELLATLEKEYVVLNCPPGSGKALALDTPILTTKGWSTMGELSVGDQVYDDQGRPTTVTFTSEVFEGHDCYRVVTDDGAHVIADADHLWEARLDPHVPKPDYPGKTGPKPTRRIYDTRTLAKPRGKRPRLAVTKPLMGEVRELPVDPYVLGIWLGDGSSDGATITCHPDDARFIRPEFEAAGYKTVARKHPNAFGVTGTQVYARDGLHSGLRRAGVLGNKHIPPGYLGASVNQRLSLLQGLIDSDGHVDRSGAVEFCNTNRFLAQQVLFLVRSLGVKASLNEGRARLNGKDCGPKYRVCFMMAGAARLPRKAERCRDGVRTPYRYLTVTPCPSRLTRCIQVDSPSHLFLAGEGLMVTHNTTTFQHDIPLWLTCRNRAIRGMMGHRVQTIANTYASRLKRTLERTVPLQARDDEKAAGVAQDATGVLAVDYGRFKPDNGSIWTRNNFTVAQFQEESKDEKEATWTAFGMDAGFLGYRVDFANWDDLVAQKTLKNEEQIEQQRIWWDTEGETRLEPGGLLLLVGQRLSSIDLYRYNLDKEAGIEELDMEEDVDEEFGVYPQDKRRKYTHLVYKAHDDGNCRKLHKPTDPAWRPDGTGGCLLDPRRITWRDLRVAMTNPLSRYATVYQQEDVDPTSVLVQKLWVEGGRGMDGSQFPGCWDKDRRAWEFPHSSGQEFNTVTVDPSPTRFWSVQFWCYVQDDAMPHLGGLRYLIDHVRQAMDAPSFLDFNTANRVYTGLAEEWWQLSKDLGHPYTRLIVEENAAQRFMLQYDHVKRWASARNVSIIPHQTHRNKSNPEFGVQTVAPQWRYGRIRLPGKWDDPGRLASMKLVDEVTKWPDGGTDDCVMAHWFHEYHLPNFVIEQMQMPSIYKDIPRWVRRRRPPGWPA
jgi:hypothetical protein